MDRAPARPAPRVLGRYLLCDEIASGGMATVHLARLLGPVGFSRTVAIKKLHAQYAKDPEFVTMFLDEARLAARVRHPNVVPTVDVVAEEGELFLVMEYVHGESLAYLMRLLKVSNKRMPLPIVTTLFSGVLLGLHAAHEAKNEQNVPLGIVHRDVSPQNILVGTDGVARVLDFGVAKAVDQTHSTLDGQLKGKLPYMSPEHVRPGSPITRKTDVFSASVVLWEVLTGQRVFRGETSAAVLSQILDGPLEPPSAYVHALPRALDGVLLRGLARDPTLRYETALDMAKALERAAGSIASQRDVGEWVERVAGDRLEMRARRVAEVESISGAVAPDARVEPESIPRPADSSPWSVTPSFSSQVSSVVVAHGPESMSPRPAQLAGGRLVVVGAAAAVATGSLLGWLLLRGGAPDAPSPGSAPGTVAAADVQEVPPQPKPPPQTATSEPTSTQAPAPLPPAVSVISPAPAPVAPPPQPVAGPLSKMQPVLVAKPKPPPAPPPAQPAAPKPAPLPLHGRE